MQDVPAAPVSEHRPNWNEFIQSHGIMDTAMIGSRLDLFLHGIVDRIGVVNRIGNVSLKAKCNNPLHRSCDCFLFGGFWGVGLKSL